MKLPDLPEEKLKPKASEQPKRKPKVVVHHGMTAHRPDEADRKPASLFRRKPASRPAARSQPPAAPPPQPASTADLQPESHPRTASRPTPPVRSSSQRIPSRSGKGINPGLRLRAFEAAAKNAPPAKVPMKYRLRPNGELTRRAYWDVAAAMSLIINAILVGVLLVMAVQLKNLKTTVNGLLGGLYSNFVKMDQASINTTITVDAQIQLNFTLPVQQDTEVVLTRSVSIPGAYVVLNSISVPVNFTLPAGTNLPIALNMGIPVQLTVPVSLKVPVNIPLDKTALHTPFTGLQAVIRPLYCTFDKNAQYPEGTFICDEHDIPTPGTP